VQFAGALLVPTPEGGWIRVSTVADREASDAQQSAETAPAVASTPTRAAHAKAVFSAYLALTKPRIIELLLITTVPAMFLAAHGLPSIVTMVVVVLGGALAAGSANALNCYIDRDIDQVMRRTSTRPLVRHTVSPRSALVFGLVIGVTSVLLIGLTTNWLAGGLTLAAIFYYDVVYTLLLKRRTAANTFWGGACGSAPVLIGWAAVTGGLGITPWLVFAVVFFWQPPHFWALAIKFKKDYAAAGVPMLPVVASLRRVLVESAIYSWLMVACSIALWPLATSWVYGAVAVVLGALFLFEVHRLLHREKRGQKIKPMYLFHWSITYLTLLFIALAVDAFL
jgi:protoheme IX farnesyltransferase